MAIVLSHVHFCPDCDELWTCVRWMCVPDGDDVLCKACNEKKAEMESVDPWPPIACRANHADCADGRRAWPRTLVADIRYAVVRFFSEAANGERRAAR